MFDKSNLNNHEGERSKVTPLLLKQQAKKFFQLG